MYFCRIKLLNKILLLTNIYETKILFRYGFQDLESAISDYLKAVLSIKNVCLVYDMAALYGLSKLMQSCCYFMDRHAGDVIQHESFSNLSRDSLRAIISRFVQVIFSFFITLQTLKIHQKI